MNNHPHEDSIRIQFPEPSPEMSQRMETLFQNEKLKYQNAIHAKSPHRSLFYGMAATILFLIFVGSGWFWWEPDKSKVHKTSQTTIISQGFNNAGYSNPKAMIFVKPRKPSGAFDFSSVLKPNQHPERVNKRIVLHWPSQ